jgi:hypothetical protein
VLTLPRGLGQAMQLSRLKKSGSWNGWHIIWLLLLPADRPLLPCKGRSTGGWNVNELNPALAESPSPGTPRAAAAAGCCCCCCWSPLV